MTDRWKKASRASGSVPSRVEAGEDDLEQAYMRSLTLTINDVRIDIAECAYCHSLILRDALALHLREAHSKVYAKEQAS
jgi:hypothetical protein